jgi:pyrroloquinoline quinone (PQQ) biosynthesis protein C
MSQDIPTVESITAKLQRIGESPALQNRFYDQWMNSKLTLEEVDLFGCNYFQWVRYFPNALALLITATDNDKAKCEYGSTLYSELGYGNHRKVHSALLDQFLGKLEEKLRQQSGDQDQARPSVVLATTQELLQGEQALYSDPLRSKGAQLALEWQAYTMLRKLYAGAQNYQYLWMDPDEFHEDCEYFYAHLGAAEKDHKAESLSALRSSEIRPDQVNVINAGYDEHLALIGRFWNGIAKAIDANRKASKLKRVSN